MNEAYANGTSRILANVFAMSVFPVPVGPLPISSNGVFLDSHHKHVAFLQYDFFLRFPFPFEVFSIFRSFPFDRASSLPLAKGFTQ